MEKSKGLKLSHVVYEEVNWPIVDEARQKGYCPVHLCELVGKDKVKWCPNCNYSVC